MSDVARIPKETSGRFTCYCCGGPCSDVRPHDTKYGVCFRCGMADAIYKRKRSCTLCKAEDAAKEN